MDKKVVGAGFFILSIAVPIIVMETIADDDTFSDTETQEVNLNHKIFIHPDTPLSIKDVLFVENTQVETDESLADILIQTNAKGDDSQKIYSKPFLLVTGYAEEEMDFTLSEVKTDYCSESVYVLDSVKVLTDDFFECENNNVLIATEAFLPLSQDSYLITDLENLNSRYRAMSIDGVNFFEDTEDYTLTLNFFANFNNENAEDFFDDLVLPRDSIFNEQDLTKVTLTGVTAITRLTGLSADNNGTEFISEDVKPEFQTSDFVHVSNETSFSEDCTYSSTGTTNFCTKLRDFEILKDLNVNIVELTGNHNLDIGKGAYLSTLDLYAQNNMKTFGGGVTPEEAEKPLIISTNQGNEIAFIGFNESCPLLECAIGDNEPGANIYGSEGEEKAKEAISNLRASNPDIFIVATVQFRENDSYNPSSTQKSISRELIDLGSDMVMGSQAHVIQKVEFYSGKPIYYGLGNFLFDQIQGVGYRQGMFLHNYFYNGRLVQTLPVFTYISNDRRPTLATESQAQDIVDIIYEEDLIYS